MWATVHKRIRRLTSSKISAHRRGLPRTECPWEDRQLRVLAIVSLALQIWLGLSRPLPHANVRNEIISHRQSEVTTQTDQRQLATSCISIDDRNNKWYKKIAPAKALCLPVLHPNILVSLRTSNIWATSGLYRWLTLYTIYRPPSNVRKGIHAFWREREWKCRLPFLSASKLRAFAA